VKLIQQRAEAAAYSRVLCLGALSAGLRGEDLSEMAALKLYGCVGVSNGLKPLSSSLFLRRAMEYAASHGLTIFLHPLDFALANHGCAHEGAVAARLGLPGIPVAAETAALAQQLALVEQMRVRTHFCRISSARAVHMLERAIEEGLPVSADVCAHQLFLTEWDIGDFNSLCHTLPPLRTLEDRQALRAALRSGAIAALCSDHQPHDEDSKQAPFPATEPGVSALETLLPLTLRLVDEGEITFMQAIERLTLGPARVLGITAGTLATGAVADICLFDPECRFTVIPENLQSRGKNTPFAGWELQGKVTHTLLAGRFVFESDNRDEQLLRLRA
jgi:dihydroorotase